MLLSLQAQASWQLQLRDLPETIKEPLLRQFPQIEKDRLNRAQMDDLIRWIHSTLGADRVVFTEVSPGLATVTVQRIPKVAQVNFSGLSALSEAEARAHILFNNDDPYNEEILIESGERLRQTYKELGYLNAEIDVEMPTNDKGQLLLNIVVRENRRTEIADINLEVPFDDLKKELARKTRSFKGKSYTDFTLNDVRVALKETLNTEGHYLAEIIGPEARFNADETKVDLVYKFDKVDKYSIDFKGNQALTKSTLQEVLDLENYSSANPNLGAELTQKIKNFYLQEGFSRVDIHAEEQDGRTNNHRRLTFVIDEGARVRIEKYVITGKYSRHSEFYSEFIRKNSSDLIKKGFFNKEDVDKGLENLVTHLRNQGNLLAKIVLSRAPYNRTKDGVTIHVNLDEGPVTLVDSVEFIGNTTISAAELQKVINLPPDLPLRLNKLEQGIQELKNYYYEKGYIEMLLENEKGELVIYNADNTRAQLKFRIFEGPQVRVNSIVIDGNYFTKDYVILKELELPVGAIVTPSRIEESIARLQRIGHFTNIEIRTLEEKTNVSERTLLVRVTERNPGEFTMGMGATNERQLTLRGYTGIAYRNLWGTGRGVSLRLEGNYNVADVKYLENRITLGYLEPYIFDSRVRGRVNLTRAKTVTDYELGRGTEVNQTTTSIEKDFTSHVLGIWDLLSVATVRDFAVKEGAVVNETPLNIASTGPTIDVDYRDNPFNPTRGSFSQFHAEYASPLLGSSETIEYWKATSLFNHYMFLAPGPWVWANSLRAGYMVNTSPLENGGIPYDKKGFVLGGRSTIRGYEAGTSEVFPSRRDLGGSDFVLQTRAKMGLFKSEIRFPLFGSLSGALFYDGGYVEIEEVQFIEYYRDSVGFGLRYNTPVGPLNLEFGWKLDRREDEETGRFHLSIGAF